MNRPLLPTARSVINPSPSPAVTPGSGTPVISRIGQQRAQQDPSHRDIQDRQVPQCQRQRRPQKQQPLRGQTLLRSLEQLPEEISGYAGQGGSPAQGAASSIGEKDWIT